MRRYDMSGRGFDNNKEESGKSGHHLSHLFTGYGKDASRNLIQSEISLRQIILVTMDESDILVD